MRLARTSPIEVPIAKEGELLRLADEFPLGALGTPTLPTELAVFGELVARSRVMKDVFSRLLRLAERDTTLFIEGESGTGKELAARAVRLREGGVHRSDSGATGKIRRR